jgi:hypothetical protein
MSRRGFFGLYCQSKSLRSFRSVSPESCVPPIDQSGSAPIEFVLHEGGERLDEVHLLLRHLQRTRLECRGHPREA